MFVGIEHGENYFRNAYLRHQLHPDWSEYFFASEIRKKVALMSTFQRREIVSQRTGEMLMRMSRTYFARNFSYFSYHSRSWGWGYLGDVPTKII